MKLATASLTVMALASSSDAGPAALAVDARTCGQYADAYTLVRDDVLAELNDADKNLPAAEAALAQAQVDLRTLKAAADELRSQKAVLLDHVARLESVVASQQRLCEQPQRVADVAAAVWEWGDAPLAFAAGAGMCVGIAFALNQVQQ